MARLGHLHLLRSCDPLTYGGRGRGKDQVAGLGWKGGSAPWRRQSRRPGPRVLGWVVSGCRLVPRRARDGPSSSSLSLRRPPLCHRCRGCPISAAGTGARDVTLRAPPAQSPPPVLAACPLAGQTPAAGVEPPGAHAEREDSRCPAPPGPGGSLSPGSQEAQQVTTLCFCFPTHPSSPLSIFPRPASPKVVLCSKRRIVLHQQPFLGKPYGVGTLHQERCP